MTKMMRDRPYSQRRHVGGAMAEKRFMEVHHRPFERWGWNDAGINVGLLPDELRHAPDYVDIEALYECKGVGKDQLLKVKLSELAAWKWWHNIHPVTIFVWDSHKKRHLYVPLERMLHVVNKQGVTLDHFNEGKAYLAVPLEEVFGD